MIWPNGGPARVRRDRGVAYVGADRPERVRMVRRSAVPRAIDEVDAIAFLDVVMRPARLLPHAHVVERRAAAPVHEDDRIWMADLRRGEVLHEHLAGDDRAVGHLFVLGADPEVAGIGQLHRRRVFLLRGRFRRGDLRAAVHVLVDPRENRLQHLTVVLLDHHHVAVAVDSQRDEPHLLGLAARLLEVRDAAGISRRSK